ncbi:hypothetical protein S7335_723 [Synechococcus sp. PCC 7335]|nr:hypothetical protein S7335_723 [Synechococcus sp. PCC 7335]
MVATLRASIAGLRVVDQARRKKGSTKERISCPTENRPLAAVSQTRLYDSSYRT